MSYGLYVHIPFCRKKCNYCDFVSKPAEAAAISAYMEALYLEMQKYQSLMVATMYVGGGTPSLLSAEQIRDLYAAVRRFFNCTHSSESTFELNPESITDEKLRTLKIAGVNRLSIGAQALQDEDLKYLGRVHTVSDFENAYHAARRFRFDNVSFDLIYGLPDRTLNDWKATLQKAVTYRPEHLSLYPLSIEKDTPFHQTGIKVDDDLQAQIYEWSLEFLSKIGYEHYEISNWALPGFSSKHNLIYWQNKEYLGLGPAAASYLEGKRWKNCTNIEEYVRRVADGGDIIAEEEEIDEDTRLAEEMILKLRCSSGVLLTPTLQQRYGEKIERLIGAHLLERKGQNIRLTKRGLLLANQALQEFV
jgi:oxygen-independent coproporphyrinogen-3 oxidase